MLDLLVENTLSQNVKFRKDVPMLVESPVIACCSHNLSRQLLLECEAEVVRQCFQARLFQLDDACLPLDPIFLHCSFEEFRAASEVALDNDDFVLICTDEQSDEVGLMERGGSRENFSGVQHG